jgi:hypothetical protein
VNSEIVFGGGHFPIPMLPESAIFRPLLIFSKLGSFIFVCLLIGRATAAEFSGVTYTSHQDLIETTKFLDCTFEYCEGSEGGAISLTDGSLSLDVINCLFAQCSASLRGGAMRIDRCHSFSINGTSGLNCSAQYNSFCYWDTQVSGGLLVFFASSGTSNSCEDSTIWSGGSGATIESLNLSLNWATEHGSGLYVCCHSPLSFQFCTFWSNGDRNCLVFADGIENSDISCLGVINNSCQSSDRRPGLLHLDSMITFYGCIFQLNTFDYFVGSVSDAINDTEVTFIDCVFDFEELNTTRSISISTTNCVT